VLISHHRQKKVFDTSYCRENISYILDDILNAKYNPPYDCIITFEFLEHVQRAPDIIKMCSNLSNRIIASVPNETVHPFNPKLQIAHVRHYTELEFEELLGLGGFTVSEMYTQINETDKPEVIKGNHGRHLIAVAEK